MFQIGFSVKNKNGMANSADPDETAHITSRLIRIYTVCTKFVLACMTEMVKGYDLLSIIILGQSKMVCVRITIQWRRIFQLSVTHGMDWLQRSDPVWSKCEQMTFVLFSPSIIVSFLQSSIIISIL